MKSVYILCSLIFLICMLRVCIADEAESNDGVYIVYMGTAANSRNNHNLLLTSLAQSNRNAIVHNYQNSFLGFAAHLTEEEAQDIARKPGVVSVFPDPILKLHTTRSWDFLKYQTGVEIDFRPSTYNITNSHATSDIVIGVLDTGIWPESESFNDDGFGPIPSKWKGTCMESKDFTSKNCNRKLIGARYYKTGGDDKSPRDRNGHGTHVASTAAGNAVSNASYYGLAMGSAKGGFPGSRIAMYRVCGARGCVGSNILAAFDDAIEDGVDVLSLSLGSSAGYGPNFQRDPIAIGSFHAVEKGITVVASAGNDGPQRESVVNVAPWILTVAASSIDRDFQADITLGDKTVIKGGGINFGELKKDPVYPLLYGSTAKRNSTIYDESDARNCIPRALDREKVKGNIILCENDEGMYTQKQKLSSIKQLGALGMVFVSDEGRAVASSYGSFSMATVNRNDGSKIISYVTKERNPTVTILPTVSLTQYKPAPVVAYFSARGPSFATQDILKGYDMQQVSRWVEQILPFSLLLMIVFIRQHLQGFFVTIYVSAFMYKSNDILRKQTALKGERKFSVLAGYYIVFVLQVIGVYWWYQNEDLCYPLFMVPPRAIPPFWHAIFTILVNDTMVRQSAMAFKLVLLMYYRNGKGHNFRRQGQMLTLVEYGLLLYRAFLPAPVWYRFFLNKEYGSLFSSLTTGLYLTFKLTSVVEKVGSFWTALKALSRKEVHYGSNATPEQVIEAGDMCAICQEKMQAPVLLRCKHIFCEDCVSEWFERERTCPLCRAVVKPAELRSFGDGSTSLICQLF